MPRLPRVSGAPAPPPRRPPTCDCAAARAPGRRRHALEPEAPQRPVILIMAISKAFELGLVAGLSRHELAWTSQGDLTFGDNSYLSREEPAIRHRPSQFVPAMRIQDSKTYLP
ncbi:Teratocarcinoma-derived growth factor 2 [Pteropus alecto]|uniref:Teratocarcinoma-derived growth factor 2 n=1 Tax=Pteropus alecto TaxID=9402 RepID=L5KEQ7_PTEAL|nr:Teratocarcinoma-derived growth factor 2 [Pteropus alecto]